MTRRPKKYNFEHQYLKQLLVRVSKNSSKLFSVLTKKWNFSSSSFKPFDQIARKLNQNLVSEVG